MFPQFKKLNNESGIVLFIVLMTAIIIMIFSVGILTQSMNEVNYAQHQVDQIECDQAAKGTFWNEAASGMNSVASGVMSAVNIPGSGRTYDVTTTTGASVNGVTTYNVVCNFDTFQ